MRALRYSVPAKLDLVEIVQYTRANWGEAQTDRYLSLLATACERLVTFPFLGTDVSRLVPGLRRLNTGSHMVFYVAAADSIAVIRILHQRMLPTVEDFASDLDSESA